MNQLVFLRMQRQMTQRQLAARLGISNSLLCRMERGWFTRAPNGVEAGLQQIFGQNWTFERLMRPVPDLPRESTACEARA